MLARLQVGHEGRCPDQVGDGLAQVARRIERQVFRRDAAAPGDLVICIQQQHAIGGRFDGREELGQALTFQVSRALTLAQRTFNPQAGLAPKAHQPGRAVVHAAAEPAQQASAAPGVDQHHHQCAHRHAQCSAQPGPAQRRPGHRADPPACQTGQPSNQDPRPLPEHARAAPVLRRPRRWTGASGGSLRRARSRSSGRSRPAAGPRASASHAHPPCVLR